MNVKKKHSSDITFLNSRSDDLSKKHSQALKRMSYKAIQAQHNQFRLSFFMPTVALAFSVIITITLYLNNPNDEKIDNEIVLAPLPDWVEDTQVPLPVIEQLAFYSWLAQQQNTHNAQIKIDRHNATVKDASPRIFKLASRQQFTAFNTP